MRESWEQKPARPWLDRLSAAPKRLMKKPAQNVVRAAPSVELGRRIYAIGDIHGRLDLLDRILDAIDADMVARPHPNPRLIFLGDYIDRGPHSAGVVHRLIEVTEVYDAVCLMGNHEIMLTQSLSEPQMLDQWRRNGGLMTLQSYGIVTGRSLNPEEAVAVSAELNVTLPESHRQFLFGRPLTEVSGDYLFVHAGLRPNCSLALQAPEDLLWIRNAFLDHEEPFEKFVIHGHTPATTLDVRPNRINIDTGAFATNRLSCLVLEGQHRHLLQT